MMSNGGGPTMNNASGQRVHDLKVWPEFFLPIVRGEKTCDVRLDDREYAAGDVLRLREYDPQTNLYTGRETARRVTHVLRGGSFGIAPEYVVLSMAPFAATEAA